jgi:hypothetical protein
VTRGTRPKKPSSSHNFTHEVHEAWRAWGAWGLKTGNQIYFFSFPVGNNYQNLFFYFFIFWSVRTDISWVRPDTASVYVCGLATSARTLEYVCVDVITGPRRHSLRLHRQAVSAQTQPASARTQLGCIRADGLLPARTYKNLSVGNCASVG